MTWVDAAKRGDFEAREQVIEWVLPRMEAYVRLNAGPLVSARESSSDLVQSICREILGDLHAFRGASHGQFKSWLFKLALHKIQKRHRHMTAQRRDARRDRRLETREHPPSERRLLSCYHTFCTPSRQASAREELARIEAAVRELPEDQRRCMTMAHVVGLSYEQIAGELGKNEAAVRKLVSRARARLLLLLALDEEEP